jgi:hypothetical protein
MVVVPDTRNGVAMPAKGQRVYKDLSGERFGRWKVIRRVDSDECGHVMYRTLCDCGWIGTVKAYALRNGSSKSCGCLAAELTRENWRKKGKDYFFGNRLIARDSKGRFSKTQ